jgi:hypothetical protein
MKSSKFVLLIFILLSSTNIFSQLSKTGAQGVPVFKNERFYISINGGLSIPLSDFSKTDVDNSSSGYAKIGYSLEGNASFRITPLISVGLMSFYNTNPTNLEPIMNYLNSNYPAFAWSGNSNNWHMYGLLGGLSFNYFIAPKISAEMKALGGWLGAKSPEFSVASTSAWNYGYYRIQEKNVDSWSYLLAMNVKYDLTNSVSAFSNIEYLGSNPNFNNVNTSLNINGTTITSNDASFKRKIDALIFGIGLRYSF